MSVFLVSNVILVHGSDKCIFLTIFLFQSLLRNRNVCKQNAHTCKLIILVHSFGKIDTIHNVYNIFWL